MKIDFPATKKKMIDKGLNLTRWARAKRHSPVTVLAILRGNYPTETGRMFKLIIEDLRADGYLVEVPEESEQAA